MIKSQIHKLYLIASSMSILKNEHEHLVLIFQIWNPEAFSHSSGRVMGSEGELGTSA